MSEIPTWLTEDEAYYLRKAFKKHGSLRNKALLEIMLSYGPRVSEVASMKVDHIDLIGNTIYLQRLKSGNSNVWPLFRNVKKIVTRYLEHREVVSSFLFPGRPTTKGISRKRVWDIIQKYGKIAGIPKEKRHPHICRHYAGVHALEAGCTMEEVQDLLGHKSITSTQIYAKITDKRRQVAFKKLEGTF